MKKQSSKTVNKRRVISKYFIESLFIGLVFLGIFLTSRAMFHEGFFRTIDDITTVRINHMARELLRGEPENFPVRIGAELSHQFGYFVYLFYSPLVYYAGAAAMLIGGFSDIVATKIVYVFPLIIGPILFYIAARLKLSRYSSLLATLLYTFFPFRGFDTYIRGGVGEAWSMAFLPGVFIGLFLHDKKSPYAPPLITIFLSLIILSHNLSALLVLALLIFYILLLHPKSIMLWLSVFHSLLITAFFYAVAFNYFPIVKVFEVLDHNGSVTNYLQPVSKLLSPVTTYETHDKTSPWLFYILILSSVYFLIKKRLVDKDIKIPTLLSLIGLVLYLLMTRESIWLWETFYSYLSPLQFPWRLLILISTITPLAFGFFVEQIKITWIKLLSVVYIVWLSSLFLPVFKPLEYHNFYSYSAEDTGPCATSVGEEYIPKWVKKCIARKPGFIATGPEDSVISEVSGSLINTNFNLKTETGGYLEVNRYYFPGWQIIINDSIASIDYQYGNNGLFRTIINPGEYKISVKWQKTPLMRIVDSVSLISVIVLLGQLIYVFKSNKK